MRIKLPPRLIPAILFVVAGLPLHSQVRPAATQGGVPVVVGVGFSDYSLDWGPDKRMEGISAWVDVYPRVPKVLNGLGIEATGHAIDFGDPFGSLHIQQDTAEIGPIYTINRYRKFRPYGKYLLGIGSIDFPFSGPYKHDTFLVFSPGAGVEYRAWRHVWLRADYEYQFWHHTLGDSDLDPNGITVGASYDFRNWRAE
jgi:opacity protein-like surface antigen